MEKENKIDEEEVKENESVEKKKEEVKETESIETKKDKVIEEKTKKKEIIKEISAKDVAVVNGFSLRISPKSSKYICNMIRGKDIDRAIKMLGEVVLKKRAVKMDGAEIPHRKGKGMMSGRYPVNASKEFIVLLKQLKANSFVNQIENPIITVAIANKATLPYKRDGKRGKRAHIKLESRDKTKFSKKTK